MSSIRKTKKAMKKSNGFFTLEIGDKRITNDGLNVNIDMCFCATEWMDKTFHKKGVTIDHDYIPYSIIKKIVVE